MTILRAASFGMPAYTRHTAQTSHIAVRPWLTSRRAWVPRVQSLRLKRSAPGRAGSRLSPSALFRVTGPVSRSLVA